MLETGPRRVLTATRAPAPFLVAILLASMALAQETEPPAPAQGLSFVPRRARAVRIDASEAPAIDGSLSDAVWARVPPIPDLRMREPVEDGEPTERTVVRVAHDGTTLYVAFRCFDSEPDGIRATQRRRDARLQPDDRVEILLDTQRDRRNAYFFAIGAGGAINDALVSQNGGTTNRAWDGIWEGRARIDEEGWSAEMAIPFRTLATSRDVTVWGFNVERFIRRKREELAFGNPTRDVDFERVSEAGELEGLEDLDSGVGLDVVPYVKGTASTDHLDEDSDLLGTGGGELFYRLTPGITGALTVNTDFAETEVDERRVNLSRFPLFFPEKRKFFLEDAGLFSFETEAGGGGRRGSSNDLLPFFSRRIGLDGDGDRLPIQSGVKVSGFEGDWSGGVLGVRTGTSDSLSERELFVARARHNVDDNSTVGAIFTSGNPAGTANNQVAGFDYRYSTGEFLDGKNFDVSAFALQSFTEGASGREAAFGAEVRFPNDFLDGSLSAREVGDEFFPALGFVERTGVRRYAGTAAIRPRPGGDVRRLFLRVSPVVYTDLSDRLQTSTVETSAGIEMESGDEASVSVTPVFDRIDESFEIVPGLTVPADTYRFERYRARAESSSTRPVVAGASFEWGDFLGGERTDIELELDWRPDPLFQIGAESVTTYLRLPGGDADIQIGRVRTEVNFSPDVSWQTFVQFDNVSESAGVNSRLRWIIEPGRDLFVVLNHGWQELPSRAVVPDRTDFVAKLVFTIRF